MIPRTGALTVVIYGFWKRGPPLPTSRIAPYYGNDLAPLHLMSIKCPETRHRANFTRNHISPALWLQTTPKRLRVKAAGPGGELLGAVTPPRPHPCAGTAPRNRTEPPRTGSPWEGTKWGVKKYSPHEYATPPLAGGASAGKLLVLQPQPLCFPPPRAAPRVIPLAPFPLATSPANERRLVAITPPGAPRDTGGSAPLLTPGLITPHPPPSPPPS